MAESILTISSKACKRAKVYDILQCVFCQKQTQETLSTPSEIGLTRFKTVTEIRRDCVYTRIKDQWPEIQSNIKWHGNCYKTYTTKSSVDRLLAKQTDASCTHHEQPVNKAFSPLKTRSVSDVSIDWDMCVICQKKYHKNDSALSRILTATASEAILHAAEVKMDSKVLMRVRGEDLIAVNAKYHRLCYMSYTSKSNLKISTDIRQPEHFEHDEAFSVLISEIDNVLIEEKGTYLMSSLLVRYQELLTEKVEAANNYRSEKLKNRLKRYYGDRIVFQASHSRKSELIFSSTITLGDALIAARRLNEDLEDTHSEINIRLADTDIGMQTPHQILHHASLILKAELKTCNGIANTPINSADISNECANELVPDQLYRFLRSLLETERGLASLDINQPRANASTEQLYRQILSISQDIIHTHSRGTLRTPKHVGIAVTIRNMTGSKQLVNLLNRFGHSISYDELERIDTAIAIDQLKKASENEGILIPSNIAPGTFVQAAADNDDLLEETLDGKNTTHATTLVLYQRKSGSGIVPGQFGNKPSSTIPASRSRSVSDICQSQNILEFSAIGKRPQPMDLLRRVSPNWFKVSNINADSRSLDAAWMLCRLCPRKLFDVSLEPNENQLIPSWTSFQVMVSENNPPITHIGYCPMFPASPTEYSTVYTVLTATQNTTRSLKQETTVITFDEAIYCKAREIMWRCPDEFTNVVVRLGGFHMALTFLASIGKLFDGSGLDDVFVESDIYGRSTADRLLKGKSYNRAVRAHKIMVESLMRLRWKALADWIVEERNTILVEWDEDRILYLIKECQHLMSHGSLDSVPETVGHIVQEIKSLFVLQNQFETERRSVSATFGFWNFYIELISCLLDFIRAERDGLWELHLDTVARMIPLFFAADRVNYARWSCVYLADMKRLPISAPEVHKEFLAGNHPVKRSEHRFNQVWTDMALEQSVNRDSKMKGGIIGFSKRPGALNRWFITAHERAAITTATTAMAGLQTGDSTRLKQSKELGPARNRRDENDVQSIVNILQDQMINPFSSEVPTSLCNIATGAIATNDVSKDLMSAFTVGEAAMTKFVDERLHTGQTTFYNPVQKLNLRTFSSMTTNSKRKKGTSASKLASVNEDRELFSRIVVVAKTRDINLVDVFCHELSSVPYSLAHADGTLRKTAKSALLGELEKMVTIHDKYPIEGTATWIFDGMALLQMISTKGISTFGQLSDEVFKSVIRPFSYKQCHRIDVVFDRYDWNRSIKSFERARREIPGAVEICIRSKQTPIPKDWKRFMGSCKNKAALTHFLCKTWSEDAPNKLELGQVIVLAGGFTDGLVVTALTRNGASFLPHLYSTHEEADTRILLHAADAAQTTSNIVVVSPDTDVAVLCIHFVRTLPIQLWFKTGVKDKIRYIPIRDIALSLGSEVCELLPGLHAVTGCDSTSSILNVGKVKPLSWVRKNLQDALPLQELGTAQQVTLAAQKACSLMICKMYQPDYVGNDLNMLRYKMFCRKQGKNENLPPTTDSLTLHVQRANYQCLIWKHAMEPKPDLPSPLGCGWEEHEGTMTPHMMTLDAAPRALMEIVTCGCKASKCKGRCKCSSEGLPCTSACACEGEDDCHNTHKPTNSYVCDSGSDDSDDNESI